MNFKIFFILTLIVSIHVEAKDLKKVTNKCLEKDWSQVQCRFGKEAFYTLSYLNPPIIEAEGPKKGGEIRSHIINKIQETFINQNLTACQKATLLKCVTSSITYKESLAEDTTDLLTMYQRGAGGCREFSIIFNDMARSLGLKSHRLSGFMRGTFHAFNLLEVEGLYYYVEPQSEHSYFYTLPKQTLLEDLESLQRLRFVEGRLEDTGV